MLKDFLSHPDFDAPADMQLAYCTYIQTPATFLFKLIAVPIEKPQCFLLYFLEIGQQNVILCPASFMICNLTIERNNYVSNQMIAQYVSCIVRNNNGL